MDEAGLRRDVLNAFEYAHNRDDWVNPVAEVLAGVTAADAHWRPGPMMKGIWDIVLHLVAWTENCVTRMRNGTHSRPPEGAWPAPPETPDESAWSGARQRLTSALDALRAEIEATPPAALLACSIDQWSPLDEVFCRFIHNAYHIGEITKLRELQARQGGAR